MADEIQTAQEEVSATAAETVASAEAEAKKLADAAKEEAEKIASESGEDKAQRWLGDKLTTIEANLSAKIAASQSWFQEEMQKFQQQIFDQTKTELAKLSTPAQSPEKVAETAEGSSGSPSVTSEEKTPKQSKKRRRI